MRPKIKVYARGSGLVTRPGYRPVAGNLPRYVGRRAKLVDGVRKLGGQELTGKQATFPATQDGEVFDLKSDAARELLRRVRHDELWAANEETAKFCGVPYVALEFTDGDWTPRKQSAPKKPPQSKPKGETEMVLAVPDKE